MKILLDECVTKKLKSLLADYEVRTVREMEWSGIKNGKLLTLCVENGFSILLTVDKNLHYQQNIPKFPVAVVVFDTNSSKIEDLQKFITPFVDALSLYKPYNSYLIACPK